MSAGAAVDPAGSPGADASHADFATLFDFLPIGAYRSLPDGTQLRANPALVRLNGYRSEAELLAAVHDIGREWYVEPDRRAEFCARMERDGHVTGFVSEIWRHGSRERIWISENAHVVRDAAGRLLFYEGTVEEITDRVQAQAALRRSEEELRLLTAQLPGVLYRLLVTPSGQRRYTFVSEGVRELCGVTPQQVMDDPELPLRLVHPEDVPVVADHLSSPEAARRPIDAVFRIVAADGRVKWVQMSSSAASVDERGTLRVGVMVDISERKQAEALIWQQANFDALTGLPNRRMLRDRLEQAIRQCRRDGSRLAVLFVDLDHFKQVNDTVGHAKGDLLLVEAARRIVGCVREVDTVARFGGDEFTVVLGGLRDTLRAGEIAQHIVQALGQAYDLAGETAFVSASVGITLHPDDAHDIEDLLKYADQALYVAKDAGRNRVSHFTPELQQAAVTRSRLAKDLRAALAEGQLHLAYQPIVALGSGAVHKAEALLRWRHPVRGPVPPGDFIPIAESTGLIVDIGDWVFREAVRQVQAWRARLCPDFQLSVNKSPVQFVNGGGRHDWIALLRQAGLPGQCVVLEITESLLLDAASGVSEQLLALRDAGIGVSLDDFGTGYSSMAYLQHYDIDHLKIDQRFVRHLGPGSKELALCKAIIVMAHELGMTVIAEGVETAAQRDLLAAAGCDYGQGYLFARPMAPADFEAWLAARPPA
ncbi:putative bifunctional diguanylate cyclase/phosphodiesterase [Piscinibacter sakaiensis]|uniref:Diguanylate cyclase/phosphodiesterase with PAS/PAC sensor(S) n=1 Tax=Piscinibacter sakaiensis TaxID=1547922 RepID=A0A0K8NTP7_PISS1|nr:bifunctional diguanylate cyclase/phosphodiesterase [Piscinibacter sakaiensis]GAP33786.1 diguanylate cyclase/phosphodiesterase with PAS/PAC sensor(s) [Piscinibacter sakaiensis]